MLKRHALTSAVLLGVSFTTMIVHAEVDPQFSEATIDEEMLQKLETAANAEPDSIDPFKQELEHLDQQLAVFGNDPHYQLGHDSIPEIDENMVSEIYRIAEQAQLEASQQILTHTDPVNAMIAPNILGIEEQKSNQEQVVEVDNLLTSLGGDSLNLPVITEDRVESEDGREEIITAAEPKRTWLDKLLRREAVEVDTIQKKLPRINTSVIGLNSDQKPLKDNIEAILANFTVEAFNDFNAALPQLRNMTRQASQAVGYYDATFRFTKVDENSLRIDVVPNQPVIVNKPLIEITGDGATRPAFRVIPVVPDLKQGEVLNHAKYESLQARIDNAASDLGYFDGYWRMHDVRVNVPENTADIQLKYETQNRYKFKDVEFVMIGERKELPIRREILESLVPFKDNDDYSNWRVNTLTSNLTNSRYFNYTLINVIKPDPLEKKLELPEDLALLEQQSVVQQSLVQNVEAQEKIQQAEVTEQEVVTEEIFAGSEDRRMVTPKSSDTEELEDLKQKAREEQKIPVIVSINADKLNNVESGIGFGTDTGIRLRTQYRRAIVNDRGHSFDANIELSQIRQSFDGRYMIPYNNPLNDYISLVGGYEREERDSIGQGVELNIESAVFGAERIIKKPLGDWQHNMMVRYRLDRIDANGAVDIDDIPDAFKIITDRPEQQSLLFGYEVSKVNQNNRVNPTIGFRQFYRAEIGSESLLTETDMAIINAGWRFIYSLGKNANHQFVGRTDVGYIFTDDFDRVPYNLRYFAGGDQSIRGYDYKSLSPKEDQLLLGGQSLAVGSLEYNYQFKPGWRGAIFADVGNAYDEKFTNETKYGVGLGLRWASPVGPIRIDVGAGVSEESVPIRLHFFIGPSL